MRVIMIDMRDIVRRDYIPNLFDTVQPLPYISSNRIDWTYGVVTKVFTEGLKPECWISTDTGHEIIEYCDSIYPLLTATDGNTNTTR